MREPRKNRQSYYRAYPRDFFEGTIGMRLELKAAYSLVIDLIHMTGGALPDEPRYIAAHLGCSVRKWAKLRDELIAAGTLHAADGLLTNQGNLI